MPLLPWLGNTIDTSQWSQSEITTFAVISYLVLAVYIASFALLVANLSQYIVERRRKALSQDGSNRHCEVKQPLLVFYLLAAFSLFTDMYFTVFIALMEAHYAPFLRYLPPTWKVLLGIEQVWLLFEFCYQLRDSMKKVSQRLDRSKI